MRRRWPIALALCVLLPGCAWTNRANRPVWNAFETHLVPDDGLWFGVSLPLTVPVGLLAIVADTVVAHPVQVVDDAFGDAVDLWTEPGPNFDERYYSELAFLPLRVAATPTTFAGSFLWRSMFDVPPRSTEEQERQQRAQAAVELGAWLRRIAAGRAARYGGSTEFVWSDDLREALRDALRTATPFGRLALYRLAMRGLTPPDVLAPTAGLRDRDPVIRYRALDALPRRLEVEPEIVRALRIDDVESIRLLARRRFAD